MKDSVDAISSSSNIELENTKAQFSDQFKNPYLLGEIYKDLSISDVDALNYIERTSHCVTVKQGYDIEPNIHKFVTSEETLDSCLHGQCYSSLFCRLLPSMFSSFKELYMGKISWSNCLNRLNDEDLREVNNITAIPNDLSKKQLITEIRNALNHSHYVPGRELYIKNPKDSDPTIHAYDFEANIPYTSLAHFISLTMSYNRRADHYKYKIDNQKLLDDLRENRENIRYRDNKDKIHFYQGVSKEKLVNKIHQIDADTVETKEIIRSEKLERILSKYFDSNKLDRKNLLYISECLAKPPEIYMREIFFAFLSKGFNTYNGLNSIELSMDIYTNMEKKSCFSCFNECHSEQERKIMVDIGDRLKKERQTNGRPLLEDLTGCVDYAHDYLINNGFFPSIQGNDIFYKKGDITINFISFCRCIEDQYTRYYVVNKMVQSFGDWFRIWLVKATYVNELISRKDDNVPGLEGKPNGGELTNRERVRNSLVHDTYIHLQGVDDILLRDGYDKKTDSWEWEEIVNLPQLFSETRSEFIRQNGSKADSILGIIADFIENKRK